MKNVDNQLHFFSEVLKLPLGVNSFQARYYEQICPFQKPLAVLIRSTGRWCCCPPPPHAPVLNALSILGCTYSITHETKRSLTGGSALSGRLITAVLEQWTVVLPSLHSQTVLGMGSDKPKAPASSPVSILGDLCPIFERVSVHTA